MSCCLWFTQPPPIPPPKTVTVNSGLWFTPHPPRKTVHRKQQISIYGLPPKTVNARSVYPPPPTPEQ